MDLEDLKKKFGEEVTKKILKPVLQGFEKIGGGKIFQKDDNTLVFTGQEADDRRVNLVSVGMGEEKDINSAFTTNSDGSFRYPKRKEPFKRHEAYEMNDAINRKLNNYKRR